MTRHGSDGERRKGRRPAPYEGVREEEGGGDRTGGPAGARGRYRPGEHDRGRGEGRAQGACEEGAQQAKHAQDPGQGVTCPAECLDLVAPERGVVPGEACGVAEGAAGEEREGGTYEAFGAYEAGGE